MPVTVGVFFGLGRLLPDIAAAVWLTVASLIFYGWWNPRYVILLLLSIAFNYAVGQVIWRVRHRSLWLARLALIAGLSGDLGLLAYFKYANFFVNTIEPLVGVGWQLAPIILPLGISFFTFTQIAFLVDNYRKRGVRKGTQPDLLCVVRCLFPASDRGNQSFTHDR